MQLYQGSNMWFQVLLVVSLSGIGMTTGREHNGKAVYIAPREEDRTASPRQYDDEIRHPHSSRDDDGPPETDEGPGPGSFYGDHDAHETKQKSDSGDGFVEPLDFNSFLSQVGSDKKSDNLPLFAAASNNNAKDYFSGFFGSNNAGGGLLGLSSSASNQNSKKADELGFVDPNVQFRSLFDSAETATGFRPEDFLGNKGNSHGSEPSKGSQTRTFPQFTYTGREDDEEDLDEEPKKQAAGSKFRSSYRQVDGRDRHDGHDRNDDRRSGDPYDDSQYYDGEYDDSPAAPPNPRYQQSQNRYQPQRFSHRQGEVDADDDRDDREDKRNHAPAVQASAPAPRAKASESKNNGKCKKVEKTVDYNEDYSSFVEPEEGYDPSTYTSRYKRQAGRSGGNNRQQGQKRPMTCYVCEDEQGRYAERCSYDSKADPSKGSYFTSSSSSYSDNGKNRPRNNNNRGREGSERYRRYLPTPKPEPVTTTTTSTTLATAESRTDRNKRQDQYSGSSTSRPNRPDFDYEDFSDFGFGDRNTESSEPQVSPSERRTEANTYGAPSYNNGPTESSSERNHGPSSRSELAYRPGPNSANSHNNRPATDRPSRDFDFGQPSGFNSEESIASSDKNFDFSIPKEFDFETHTANSNNRPTIRGSSDDDNFGLGDYSTGYEDYVRRYFPGAFGSSTEGPGSSSSTHSSRGPTPAKEHTQQSNSFAYPPFEYEDNTRHLSQMLGAFTQKDRSGCHKVQKGDMTCYVCRDSKGMNKEECMYAAADPTGKNTRVAYEESTEYSSPQATVLLRPINLLNSNKNATHFRK